MTGYYRIKIDDIERTADSLVEAKAIATELINDFNISPNALVKIVYVQEIPEYSKLVEDLLREDSYKRVY